MNIQIGCVDIIEHEQLSLVTHNINNINTLDSKLH